MNEQLKGALPQHDRSCLVANFDGNSDFCLLSKRRNSSWTVVSLNGSDLPPLECSSSIDPSISSPPPGRPTNFEASRKRAASSSPVDYSKKPSKRNEHEFSEELCDNSQVMSRYMLTVI